MKKLLVLGTLVFMLFFVGATTAFEKRVIPSPHEGITWTLMGYGMLEQQPTAVVVWTYSDDILAKHHERLIKYKFTSEDAQRFYALDETILLDLKQKQYAPALQRFLDSTDQSIRNTKVEKTKWRSLKEANKALKIVFDEYPGYEDSGKVFLFAQKYKGQELFLWGIRPQKIAHSISGDGNYTLQCLDSRSTMRGYEMGAGDGRVLIPEDVAFKLSDWEPKFKEITLALRGVMNFDKKFDFQVKNIDIFDWRGHCLASW